MCVPPALIEDTLAKICHSWVLYGHDCAYDLELSGQRVQFGTGGAAVNVVDFESGEYRASTLADLYDIARLVDTLDNIHFFHRPIVTTDMPSDLDLDLNTAYAVMSGTAKPGGTSITVPENVAPVLAMFDLAAGGEGRFRQRPFCFMACAHVVPPLRFGQDACTTLEAAVRLGMPVMLGSVGQAGATSPVTLAGTLVQTVAEQMAGMLFVNLIAPGHPTIYGGWPFVSDLRTGAFSGGGGEQAILMAASAQLSNYYGFPGTIAGGMTDSKAPDAQAGFEKGYTTALAGLAGGNMIFAYPGMLASLMAMCFEGLVIDNDMLGHVIRTVRGIEVTDETLAVEIIHHCATGPGHYLGHPQTLALMERDFFYPPISDRRSAEEWKEAGSPDIVERARACVRATLSTHYPGHIDPATDGRIRERFDIKLPRAAMKPGNGRW